MGFKEKFTDLFRTDTLNDESWSIGVDDLAEHIENEKSRKFVEKLGKYTGDNLSGSINGNLGSHMEYISSGAFGDDFIKHLSNNSDRLVSDLEDWMMDLYHNPIDIVCCVIRYFLTISVNLKGIEFLIKLLAFLVGYIDNLDLDINIFQIFKKMFTLSFSFCLDNILDKIREVASDMIDKISKPLVDNKILRECFHIPIVFASIKRFVLGLLDFHFDIRMGFQTALMGQIDLKDSLALEVSSDLLKQLAGLIGAIINKAQNLYNQGLDKIPVYDICNILEINTDVEIDKVLEAAYSDINNDKSIWWNNTVETPLGVFKMPSEKLMHEILTQAIGHNPQYGKLVMEHLGTDMEHLGTDNGLESRIENVRTQSDLGRIAVDYIIDSNDCLSEDTMKRLLQQFSQEED